MPAFPRGTPPTSPEQRLWQEVSRLGRRVRTLERANAAQVQHGRDDYTPRTAVGAARGSALTLATIAMNVPDTASTILISHYTDIYINSTPCTAAIGFTDDVIYNLGSDFLVGNMSVQNVSDIVDWPKTNIFTDGQNFIHNNYPLYIAPYLPNAGSVPSGDVTFKMVCYRSSGTGNFNIGSGIFSVLVL